MLLLGRSGELLENLWIDLKEPQSEKFPGELRGKFGEILGSYHRGQKRYMHDRYIIFSKAYM